MSVKVRYRRRFRPPVKHPLLADAMIVPLTRGLIALIDFDVSDEVSRYVWHAAKCKRRFYARSSDHVFLHHFLFRLWGLKRSQEVDHINTNSLDCRRHNMRPATCAQNNANKAADNPNGFKGITRASSGNWIAGIHRKNDRLYLGTFETKEQAAQCYDDAARKYFGKFARLNFPRVGEAQA